jgi:hypothetical protein
MTSLGEGPVYPERPFPNWLNMAEPNAVTNAVKQAKKGTPEEKKALFQIVTDLWVNHMLKSAPKPAEIPGLLNGILELSKLVDVQDSAEALEKITHASEQLLEQFRTVQRTDPRRDSELGEIDAKIKTLQKTIRIIQADMQKAMEEFQKLYHRASEGLDAVDRMMMTMARNIKG